MNIFKENIAIKTLFALVVFAFGALTPTYAAEQAPAKTFYLNVWAPDQVPPADAKPVEFGGNYQYQYTPESHDLNTSEGEKTVVFKLHNDIKQRYQLRWISADQPQLVSFTKVKAKKIKVQLDATTEDTDVYFELWLLDTETGEVIMCDPKVRVGGG